MADKSTKTAEANQLVRKYMWGSLATGVLPWPLVDMAVLTGVQLNLLSRLASLYGVRFSEHLGKSLIASLLGGIMPVSVTTNLVSLLKSVNPVGFWFSAASTGLLGGAATFAIGHVFIQHFEAGGTFLNFEPQQVRDYFAAQFDKGKQEMGISFSAMSPP